MTKYLEQTSPPICLHAMGQGLVNALWQEGRALREQLTAAHAKLYPANRHTLPVGVAYHKGWGGSDKEGYVELHPMPRSTVQIQVNQATKSFHINCFPKQLKQDAVNAWTFYFE